MLNSEILSIIDTLSAEKNLSKNVIIEAIEDTFTKMAENYFGNSEVISKMNLKSGEISFFQKKVVKPKVTVMNLEISIEDAKKLDPDAKNDSVVLVALPQLPFQYLPVQSMRNSIIEKICSAEKQLEYDEYKKREGEIIVGIVKKTSSMNTIVGLEGKAEAILFREGLIKTDNFRAGDKIKAYIKEVKRSDRDCQIILSRTDNSFLAALIAENVVEIQDGMIEIKAISRSCGFKAKVAVVSSDGRLDAVGACIGARGSRIKPIVDELRGEKVDIVCYDRDVVNFAKNAITPAKPVYGSYDEANNSVELVIPDDQLKLAIGKGGVNVRLASQIVGCNISVVSESERKKADQEKFANDVEHMCKALDVETSVAQFLVSSNICSPENLIEVGSEKLVKSGVFEEDVANELINRANSYVKQQQENCLKQLKELGVDDSVLNLNNMTFEIALLLAKQNVKTIKDIADLSVDEFVDICGECFDLVASEIIMEARKAIDGVSDIDEDNSTCVDKDDGSED